MLPTSRVCGVVQRLHRVFSRLTGEHCHAVKQLLGSVKWLHGVSSNWLGTYRASSFRTDFRVSRQERPKPIISGHMILVDLIRLSGNGKGWWS